MRTLMNTLMGSTAIFREADDGLGGGAPASEPPVTEPNANETPANEPPVNEPSPSGEAPKPSDTEAKLLKEVMKHKEAAKQAGERAKAFEGIDPEKARAALAAQADAERKELEARGEYSRIIEQVSAEAQTRIEAAEATANELRSQLEAIELRSQEQNIATVFATSPFVTKSLVISGDKVRALYGTHFDNVDGELVGYDKPRGAANRTVLVGVDAKPLAFEAALEKVVKADPEWERLARSTLKPGAGSGTTSINPKHTERPETGADKIRAGLASLKRPTLNLSMVRS